MRTRTPGAMEQRFWVLFEPATIPHFHHEVGLIVARHEGNTSQFDIMEIINALDVC